MKILIIGCPGSGKSTLAKKLAEILNYPLLHLDRIFHIDNYNQIPIEEFVSLITGFIESHDAFIIDGNYSNTLPLRMKYADTIIFFDIETEICLRNVLNRINDGIVRDDIAPGFDNSIIHPEFIEYVKTFKTEKQPYVENLIKDFQGEIYRITNYDDLNKLINKFKNNNA